MTHDERWIGVVFGAVITTIIGGVIYLAIPKTRQYQVVDARWVTYTYLHQKTLRHGAEWGRPWASKEAFNVRCERRQHGMRDCFCSTNQDGQESCSRCPDYDDWCEYDYYEWPVIQTKSKSGLPAQDPTYEPIEAKPPDQRTAQAVQYPVLWVNEEKENRDYNAGSLQELRQYHERDWWSVKTNGMGMFRPIEKLDPEAE